MIKPDAPETGAGSKTRTRSSVIVHVSLLIFLLPALQPLLTTDLTCGYDNTFHMWRAIELSRCLRQGYLYPRFAPDMAHGYGFLLFNFVSPGSAYVAALLNLVGLAWPAAINGTFLLGMVLGGVFMFTFARDLFGPAAGLVAAVAYIFAPFQAYDVFNRGGLSESFAWAFPPLVLWAVHRWSVQRERRFLLLAAFSLAGFILTHNLFAFLFAPILIGWVLVEGYLAHDWRVVGRGAAAGLLGLGLCSFFWLPGLIEREWVQTGRLLGTWVFDYRNNFLDVRQLLALPRVTDPALINDWPPKALGLLPTVIALLPLARWRRLGRQTRWRTALLLACTTVFAFLTLPLSRPLWDRLPLLPYVQFPWRFLGPAAFCLALLAGAALATSQPGNQRASQRTLATAALMVLLVLGNLGWFYPRHCPAPKDTSIAGMIAWERATDTLGATAKGEYLPTWVRRMPEEQALDAAYAAGGPIVRLPPEGLPDGAHVVRADYGPVDATVELESRVPFRARYLAFYYPGWRVTVDGKPTPITPTEPEGLISFDVPAGRHTVRVRFGETGLRLAADALSLLSLIGVLLFSTGLLAGLARHLSRIRHYELGIILITLLFLAAVAFNLSPYLRGPDEWRWAYAIPSQPERLWIPVVTLSAYLALTFIWIRQMAAEEGLSFCEREAHSSTTREVSSRSGWVSRWRRPAILLALVLAVPLIQASLLTVAHPDFLRPLFYRTVSAGASGVFSVGSTIEEAGDFLHRYPALMPTFPVHPQRYPPGLPLLFFLTRRILETIPHLGDALGSHLRLYQCHDVALMRLSNATIGSAVIQMGLPLASGLTLLPLYGLARRIYGQRTAAWVAALYPLVPSFALWSARWEQFYPLLVCTSWYFLHVGLTQARRSALLLAGFTLSVASILNFSILAVLLPMGVFALLWLLSRTKGACKQQSASGRLQIASCKQRPASGSRWIASCRLQIADCAAFLIGLASLWIVYQVAFGTGFVEIWRVSMSYHLGLDRGYWTWLGYHLYDFLTFLGLPLALLSLATLVRGIRDLRQRRYDALALGFALGLLLLDLSGTSRGEVARVWLFLTPLAALVGAHGLTRLRLGQRGFAIVAFLLALQLFTFNAFLRVVTTGLSDPPARTRTFDPPAIAHPLSAHFSANGAESIALLGYDLQPDTPVPGDTLHLTLYWQSLRSMTQPYTVFTHVVGPDGQLVGQQDNMPLQGTAPTTCWVAGEFIADPYDIHIDPQVTPGEYVVETGFYVWNTGERLPVTGPTATSDQAITLTRIRIGER